MKISVLGSKELQATILLLKNADRETARQTRAVIKSVTQGEWQSLLAKRAGTHLEGRVLVDTARYQVSDQNGILSTATVGRALSKGGAKPARLYAAVEFGADRSKTKTYTASRGGTTYQVRNRHVSRQLPSRKKTGRVFWPAVAEFAPRAAALYAQTAIRTIFESFEKGGLR